MIVEQAIPKGEDFETQEVGTEKRRPQLPEDLNQFKLAVRFFFVDKLRNIYRLSQDRCSATFRDPSSHKLPQFASQTLKFAEVLVRREGRLLTGVRHVYLSDLEFDARGAADVSGFMHRGMNEAVKRMEGSFVDEAARENEALMIVVAQAALGSRPVISLHGRRKPDLCDLDSAADLLEIHHAFDPASVADARQKTCSAIVLRRGQQSFRKALIAAYGGRCAISRCKILDVLEAAHIFPYYGDCTSHVTNGLLLRADLHTLFDLGLIAINPVSHRVAVHETLMQSEYTIWHDQKIWLPRSAACRPSDEALAWHWQRWSYVRVSKN